MTPEIVQLALLIRRGQLRLRDVSPDLLPQVAAVLATLTDAQEATLAQAQVPPRRALGRSRVFTTATS